MVAKFIETIQNLLKRGGAKDRVMKAMNDGAYDLIVLQWYTEGSIGLKEMGEWETFNSKFK